MKAIIMAGGKGTRLSPLTRNLPKPMVPLLDRPCIEYIVQLLKRHGITDIGITLQYLPKMVINYLGDGSEYGVKFRYFEEMFPLGTAGSVKNAANFLDETFLVISGDALTDFDLSRAIDFHYAKNALATLVLTRVEVPLEYGVVITEPNGKIARFLEKPSWSEIFSDTVNTGIYVIEPKTLNLVPEGENCDFSKDLFPLMLEKGLPLYGHVATGYWSDIGNLVQYRKAQFDILEGRVDVQIKGKEISPGVWADDGVRLDWTANVHGPCFLAEGTKVESGVSIGPYTVTGRYTRIEHGARLERAVIWNRVNVGREASIVGATVSNGVSVAAGASIRENTVIGEGSRIGEKAVILPGVKIWPQKTVAPGTMQTDSLVWGTSSLHSLFGIEGISGVQNLEFNPELAAKITAAYGACLKRGATVSVSCDEYYFSEILKYSVISSLLAIGIHVRDIGNTVVPVARFECRRSQADGGIHIRKTETENGSLLLLQFYDRDGLPIDKGTERKIENAFLQEDFPRPDADNLGSLIQATFKVDVYLTEILARIDVESVRNHRFKVALVCPGVSVSAVAQKVLDQLGCRVITASYEESEIEKLVLNNRCDLGIKLDASGQFLTLYTDQGTVLSEHHTLVLQTIVSLKEHRPMAVPVSAPSLVEQVIRKEGLPLVRTKTESRAVLAAAGNNLVQVYFDGFYYLVKVIEYLALKHTTLHDLVQSLPQFHIYTDIVPCPSEAKGRIMRLLLEEMKGEHLELIDGIKVLNDDAWALIMPDSERALFKVVVEGSSHLQAKRLTDLYKRKIFAYQQAE